MKKVLAILGIVIVVVAAVAVAAFLWWKRPWDPRARIRAQGYPATLEELNAWYPQPAGRNAADVYKKAFERFAEPYPLQGRYATLPLLGSDRPDLFYEVPLTEPISERTCALKAEFLAEHEEALQLLHEAAEVEQCRYPVDLRKGNAASTSHLHGVQKCAYLLGVEALAHAEAGRATRAVRSVCSQLALAGSMADEPMMTSLLARISMRYVAFRCLERVFNRTACPEPGLSDLQQALEQEDDPGALARAFAGERCIGLPRFEGQGLISVLNLSDRGTYLEHMAQWVRLAEGPVAGRVDAAQEQARQRIPRSCSLAAWLVQGNGRAVVADACSLAQMRAACTAVAVERYRMKHNSLPESLEDLVPVYLDAVPLDPFCGEPLRYVRTQGGYAVYSVGDDGQDNGGTRMVTDFTKVPGRHSASPPTMGLGADMVFEVSVRHEVQEQGASAQE